MHFNKLSQHADQRSLRNLYAVWAPQIASMMLAKWRQKFGIMLSSFRFRRMSSRQFESYTKKSCRTIVHVQSVLPLPEKTDDITRSPACTIPFSICMAQKTC